MPVDLVRLAITVVIYALVLGLVYWILMKLVSAIPDGTIQAVASIVVKVLFLLLLLYMILQWLPPMPRPYR